MRGKQSQGRLLPSRATKKPAHGAAPGRLGETLEQLKQAGIAATASVGTDPPVQALGDAVAAFPATELVILTSTELRWLEEGVLACAYELVPSVELILVTPVVWTGS